MTVRVRIAPSPTGSPHVGTGYMGLFNLAFARANEGIFILRIEDTDQSRSKPEYETGIYRALKWLGIQWDEGPDIGGPYGPYRQSERTEIYKKYAQKLLDSGQAYRCFCSSDRLAEMREYQRKNKLQEGYDRLCAKLSDEEIARRLDSGEPYVIRLHVPQDGICVIKDRLRGEINYNYDQIDDQILMKSDGFPTYHLANIIDDHLMEITHVIRGEEWVPSTPKHILLYKAFGWDPPEFIHLPLLLNPDGSKLSKRKNPTSIDYYQDAGFLSEALLNYLGLMSYSRPSQEEKFTLQEFVSDFDINRISLGGSIFDLKKLKWLNSKYIREDFTPEDLWQKLTEWRLNSKYMSKLIPMMQNRMDTFGDLIPACAFMLATDVEYDSALLVPKQRELKDIPAVLQTVSMQIDLIENWSAESIKKAIEEVAEYWDWPIRDITGPLFVAVSGMKVAPPLYESMALLGRDMTRRRILNALEIAGGLGRKKMKKLTGKWEFWYNARLKNTGETP